MPAKKDNKIENGSFDSNQDPNKQDTISVSDSEELTKPVPTAKASKVKEQIEGLNCLKSESLGSQASANDEYIETLFAKIEKLFNNIGQTTDYEWQLDEQNTLYSNYIDETQRESLVAACTQLNTQHPLNAQIEETKDENNNSWFYIAISWQKLVEAALANEEVKEPNANVIKNNQQETTESMLQFIAYRLLGKKNCNWIYDELDEKFYSEWEIEKTNLDAICQNLNNYYKDLKAEVVFEDGQGFALMVTFANLNEVIRAEKEKQKNIIVEYNNKYNFHTLNQKFSHGKNSIPKIKEYVNEYFNKPYASICNKFEDFKAKIKQAYKDTLNLNNNNIRLMAGFVEQVDSNDFSNLKLFIQPIDLKQLEEFQPVIEQNRVIETQQENLNVLNGRKEQSSNELAYKFIEGLEKDIFDKKHKIFFLGGSKQKLYNDSARKSFAKENLITTTMKKILDQINDEMQNSKAPSESIDWNELLKKIEKTLQASIDSRKGIKIGGWYLSGRAVSSQQQYETWLKEIRKITQNKGDNPAQQAAKSSLK